MALMLLVGGRRSGKTSTCQQLVALARRHGLSVGGIIAPAVCDAGRCTGYEVVDLASGESAALATTSAADVAADPRVGRHAAAGLRTGSPVERVGRFRFLAAGLALGRQALTRAAETAPRLVIVDEVGPLELRGGGWAAQLDLLAARAGATVFVVRKTLAGQVARRWGPGAACELQMGTEAAVEVLWRWVEAGPAGEQSSQPGPA